MNFEERRKGEINKLIEHIKSDDNLPKEIFFKELFSILNEYISNPQSHRIVFEEFLITLFTEGIKEKTKKLIFTHIREIVEPSPNLIDGFLNFLVSTHKQPKPQKNSQLSHYLNKNLDKWKNVNNPSIIHEPYGNLDKIIFLAIFENISPQELSQSSFMNIKISPAFKAISQAARDNYADVLLLYIKNSNKGFKELFDIILGPSDTRLKEVLPPSVFRYRHNYQIVDDCMIVTSDNIGDYSHKIEDIAKFSQNIPFPELFAASCLRCGKEQKFSDQFLRDFCFPRLTLNNYNGPFPYSTFLSVPRYVSYIDLKTFFCIIRKMFNK